jgi:hypothetical protein
VIQGEWTSCTADTDQGQVVGVLTLEVEGDFIRAIRNVANPDKNPDKLAHLNLPSTSGQERRLEHDHLDRSIKD